MKKFSCAENVLPLVSKSKAGFQKAEETSPPTAVIPSPSAAPRAEGETVKKVKATGEAAFTKLAMPRQAKQKKNARFIFYKLSIKTQIAN
jgi:hypothetical protein